MASSTGSVSRLAALLLLVVLAASTSTPASVEKETRLRVYWHDVW